jgi:tRNA threonylcarbamoyladenosine biosynthesis protein TsaE
MRAVGQAIAAAIRGIQSSLIIYLEGELGAGKTTLVGGLLNASGFAGHARSPTYTLIEPYELDTCSIYHLDLYRLADPREVDALGLRDLLLPGTVLLIEWPDRGAGELPPADVSILIDYAPQSGRQLTLKGRTEVGESVVKRVSAAVKP